MKIIEVPDYVELDDRQLKILIAETVEAKTNRSVHSVEIFQSSGRHGNHAHCKVYLSKGAPECQKL